MERSKFLAVSKLTLLLFLTIICVSWYPHMKNIEYENEEVSTTLEDSQAISLIQNYDADKTYYLVNRRFVKHQRSVVPFMYDTTVLKEFPKKYVSME